VLGQGTEAKLENTLKDKPKEKREHRSKAQFGLLDFYNLKKVKYTLEFEAPLSSKKLERGQYIYTLELKSEAHLTKLIDEVKNDRHKRLNINLGLHIKMLKIQEMWILGQDDPAKKYVKKKQIEMPAETERYGSMQGAKKAESWYLSP
jgi:hypothetical protein